MEKYGYPRLFLWTCFFVAVLFLFCLWKYIVWQNTWGNPRSLRLLCLLSALATVVLFSWLRFKNVVKDLRNGLRVLPGLFIFSLVIVTVPLYTAIYLTAHHESRYTIAAHWVAGGRHSCSGMEIQEPALKQKITVCHAYGDTQSAENLIVYKRSNGYGMVIQAAWAF
ncbi:hypothetical protein [Erwinia sp. 198]|uniref:hypothetical protein n=1 Tax=Erwinia sp. 198 TaxID=2022746 RepID=UPI000F66E3EC|nr:hypothetical protein [Erwinia sp. 198]RRZ94491.1 hypothetical protein EGK14_05495 [Erwinia sp. 198]